MNAGGQAHGSRFIRHIGDMLAAPSGSLMTAAKVRREASIREARGWPSGDGMRAKVATVLYAESGGYSVSMAKPGKEAAPDYDPRNPWDMTPVVHFEGSDLGYLPSFSDLFSAIQSAAVSSDANYHCLDLLGHLFARNAYMLDHELVKEVWRYRPP